MEMRVIMTKQKITQFFEDAKTDAHLSAALAKAGNESEVVEVAKRHGYDLDAADITADLLKKPEALDDTAARQVAGGVQDENVRAFPMGIGVGTPEWRGYWRGYAGGAYEEDFASSEATVTVVEVNRPG